MGKICRKTLVWLGLAGLILRSAAASESCFEESPLKQELWTEVSLLEPVSLLGELRFPISAQRPEVLTEARVRTLINRNPESGNLQLHLEFTFKDPRPVGLPFSFQAALFRWSDRDGTHEVLLDWSQNCNGPGRSMFPGQSFSATADLSDAEPEALFLQEAELSVWGSRN